MREFESKKKFRKFLYSRTMIFILLVIFVFLVRATWKVYKQEQVSRANFNKVLNETNRLAARENTLKQDISYLETDDGVDAEIRQKFRAVKPGEQVAVIVREERRKDIHLDVETTFFDRVLAFFHFK